MAQVGWGDDPREREKVFVAKGAGSSGQADPGAGYGQGGTKERLGKIAYSAQSRRWRHGGEAASIGGVRKRKGGTPFTGKGNRGRRRRTPRGKHRQRGTPNGSQGECAKEKQGKHPEKNAKPRISRKQTQNGVEPANAKHEGPNEKTQAKRLKRRKSDEVASEKEGLREAGRRKQVESLDAAGGEGPNENINIKSSKRMRPDPGNEESPGRRKFKQARNSQALGKGKGEARERGVRRREVQEERQRRTRRYRR